MWREEETLLIGSVVSGSRRVYGWCVIGWSRLLTMECHMDADRQPMSPAYRVVQRYSQLYLEILTNIVLWLGKVVFFNLCADVYCSFRWTIGGSVVYKEFPNSVTIHGLFNILYNTLMFTILIIDSINIIKESKNAKTTVSI